MLNSGLFVFPNAGATLQNAICGHTAEVSSKPLFFSSLSDLVDVELLLGVGFKIVEMKGNFF